MGMICKSKQEVWKSYLTYLLPTIIGMVTYSLYCFADVLFVSLGEGSQGLAALNISLPIFTIYSSIAVLIGVGASVTIGVCKGEGKPEVASKVLTMAIGSVCSIGMLLTVLSVLLAEPIARILGADDQILTQVLAYLRPITWGVLFYMVTGALTVLVRSDGNPKLVMVAGIVGNVINIVLDYIFVIPMKMGIFGAGLATAIGFTTSMMVLLLHFILKRHTVPFTKYFWDYHLFIRMIKNGGGASILEIATGTTIFMINVALMRISGSTAVAIYSVISNIAFIAKGLFGGMAQASQPIVSVHYGLKEFKIARLANRFAMWVAGVTGFVSWLLLGLFAKPIIIGLVSSNEQILAQGQKAMWIYLISLTFTGLNTVLMYYFQAIEKSFYSSLMSLLRGIGLIFILLLFMPKIWGEIGVWSVLPVAECLTFAVFFMIKQLRVETTLKN